jgi:hypothetical protein
MRGAAAVTVPSRSRWGARRRCPVEPRAFVAAAGVTLMLAAALLAAHQISRAAGRSGSAGAVRGGGASLAVISGPSSEGCPAHLLPMRVGRARL